MDLGDLEGLARAAYEEAGVDEGAGPVVVARSILGPASVEVVRPGALRFSTAALAKLEGGWHIYVRRAEPHAMRFAVGHELAHWLIRRAGGGLTDTEELDADLLGAMLVAPRRAFLAALRALGRDLPGLAEMFTATESLVALRYGESTHVPTALVRPGLVRVRSQLEFVWPKHETIRRWASGRPPTGLAKTKLTDDPRRIVLTGEGLEDAI